MPGELPTGLKFWKIVAVLNFHRLLLLSLLSCMQLKSTKYQISTNTQNINAYSGTLKSKISNSHENLNLNQWIMDYYNEILQLNLFCGRKTPYDNDIMLSRHLHGLRPSAPFFPSMQVEAMFLWKRRRRDRVLSFISRRNRLIFLVRFREHGDHVLRRLLILAQKSSLPILVETRSLRSWQINLQPFF